MRVPLPGGAAVGGQHSPTMHRPPRAPAAPQPVVWGQEAAESSEMGLLRALQQQWVCGEEMWLLQGCKMFGAFVGHPLGQNKQNHPWFCMETPWWLADLLREAVVIQGPWGFWQ